jgi:hypothetical protein
MFWFVRVGSATLPGAGQEPNFVKIQPKTCPGDAVCHTAKGIPFMGLMKTQTLVLRIVVRKATRPVTNIKLGL